jgi:hypothetical protein
LVLKLKESHSESVIARKYRQLQDMRQQFVPMNDTQFRVMFEEVQCLLTFVQKVNNVKWVQQLQLF